jgi:chloramphenicol O-acetyltransferase type A
MKKIDIETWSRKNTYLFFKDSDIPRYNITVDIDVTRFYQFVKDSKLSFYLSFIYFIMDEMNKIENFRYRFVNGEPYLFEQTHPSYTDTITDTDNFKIVTVNVVDSLDLFVKTAKETSEKQGSSFLNPNDERREDLVYITTFPWAKFSQVSHASSLVKYDAKPRLTWGKFEEINRKKMMPLSIEAHHALVDGRHVGMLIQNLQARLNQL